VVAESDLLVLSSPSYLNGLGAISPNPKADKQAAVELQATSTPKISQGKKKPEFDGKHHCDDCDGPG
jgi:hypothetical protein